MIQSITNRALELSTETYAEQLDSPDTLTTQTIASLGRALDEYQAETERRLARLEQAGVVGNMAAVVRPVAASGGKG